LQLVEPWIAGGKVLGRVQSADAKWIGVELHVDRARLVVPISTALMAPNAAGPPTVAAGDRTEIAFVVPGVPESSQVFWLSATAIRPLMSQRIAGGTRITLPADSDGSLLITEDPQVIQSYRQRIVRDAAHVARLQRELANERTKIVHEGVRSPTNEEFSRSFAALNGGENLLYGGDFEDLGQMTQYGWTHVRRDVPGVESSAKLSSTHPRHGRYCLELSAGATSPGAVPTTVPSAPIWIVSPPIPVAEGQVVEIAGWVRVDEPIAGNVDGLVIVDSLGGDELSLAVSQTSGWEAFRVIRGAPESSELRLTFALSGLGSACVDGVMVRTLEPPRVRRLPAIEGSGAQRAPEVQASESTPMRARAATRAPTSS
jgi:hypothetical protein